mmetsp:Transcript_33990/g.73711  ORF Transcript_33990/g.73711 Transcript_33990/m.73711 type:complete len:762 (+) Transcript_33990:115-2400(+)
MNLSMEDPPSSPAEDDQPMAAIEQNHNNDVLCGRGVTTNRHPGNERFRALVGANKELYVSSSKRQKMAISRSIVEAVRARKPPGRFLEKDVDNGLWYDIGDKKAIEKTSQALRDGAASLRKQLSDDMSDPNFLEAVFDGVDEVGRCKTKASKPGTKKAGPGHRRTNSSPAVTGRSSASLKRKNPSSDKSSAEILTSDEKSQKEALERMSGSASGAGSAPFRPDRRPSSHHHHKRTASAGAIPIGRLFSRQSRPGYPYPRQTPPSSPNPYIRPSPPMSPYYGCYHRPSPPSPFPYQCPPTPPSPAYGRSYSWGSEHIPPPPLPPPPPPPPRQNSDPSPMNSPVAVGSYYSGPPSPVAFATRRSPPTYPYSPRKSHNNEYHYHHHAPPSPRPEQHPLSPTSLPRSPRHHHHHQQQQQHYTDHKNHYQSHHHRQYPAREGYPPRSPRTGDAGNEDRPGPSTLSIPTLGQSLQASASGIYTEESSGCDKNFMPPPPTWYPDPQMSPQRPRNDQSSHHSERSHPPMSADAPQASSSVAQQQYSSPRTKLLPSRLRDNNPFSPSEVLSDHDASKVTSDQDHPKHHRTISFGSQDVAPKLEVPPTRPSGIAEEASSVPPPEQICKSFTFVDGQLMENDAPAIATSQPKKLMIMNPKQINGPSGSPNTPKAVDAVDRFEITDFGPRPTNTGDHVDVDVDVDVDIKQENPALPDFSFSNVEDDMLVFDDRSLSPLPFDGTNTHDEPLIDIGEHIHLFSPPNSSPMRDPDT